MSGNLLYSSNVVKSAAEIISKEVFGAKDRLWTWRNAATKFTLKSAALAHEEEPLYESGKFPNLEKILAYLYASELCLFEVEKIRQARDGKIRA